LPWNKAIWLVRVLPRKNCWQLCGELAVEVF
jgi:hypothetical protein